MKLGIDTLEKAGAFAGAPVEREISWEQDGEEMTATTFVRKLSYQSAVADIKASKDNRDVVAGRIASCICDKKGKPVFTADDITGESDPERGPLNHNLTVALLVAISEVNGLGKSKA